MISVACVMLANGRIDMVRRAIESFKLQSYCFDARSLIIWNSGDFLQLERGQSQTLYSQHIYQSLADREPVRTIGTLRNEANAAVKQFGGADIICHWDSDDWSHPNRIAEQVALLLSSGKQCVGYRDMLFWRGPSIVLHPATATLKGGAQVESAPSRPTETNPGEAWLYSNPDPRYCLGTSLCYWRSAWEARAFPDLPKKRGDRGEDVEWLREIDSLGVSAFCNREGIIVDRNWRMIASIHGANTQYYDADLLEQSTSWRRAPEWDGYCAERMRL